MAAFIPQDLRIYRFHPDGLDPIAVYVEQFGPEASRITVQCYAQAWTAYWGSHGEAGVEAFVAASNADYIADNLLWGRDESAMLKQYRKSHRDYVIRIARAIQAEFADQARPGRASSPRTEALELALRPFATEFKQWDGVGCRDAMTLDEMFSHAPGETAGVTFADLRRANELLEES